MIKKYVQVLLISIMLFITGINYVNAETNGGAGEILLSKTAVKEDITYGRSATVTLTVNANSFTKTDKIDVVLVLDRSASMNNSMSDVKEAAKDLVDSLLTDATKNRIRMGVVTYGDYAYNQYSSSALSNEASTIKSVIESIPDSVDNEGTNVHSGLKKANSLLSRSSTDTNKVVILLSDGDPTFFTGNNGSICGTGYSDSLSDFDDKKNCNVNGNKKPSTVAKAEATTMKNNGIEIYTVGFNVKLGSSTDNFLKSVSSNTESNSNYSYLASNKGDLVSVFKSMVRSLTIVATDAVVTDTVPKGFRIKEGTLPTGATAVLNEDGTTTITWVIGDVDSTKTQSLSYVVEAVDNEYGSMYTNVKATITATSADKNPKYGDSNPISIDFEKPYVPIPGITVDDNYTTSDTYYVKQGTTLTIAKENGILANDKLEIKNTDEDATVTDRIVLIEDGTSLDYITVDETTGAFTFTANKNTIDTITYKYYVETTVTVNNVATIVKSNTSTITLKVVKNPTKYTVNYYEEGTTNKVATSKTGNANVYDNVTENAIDVTGYTKVEPTSKVIELKENVSENVINFYYKKRTDLSYEVNYLEKGTDNKLEESKEVSNMVFESKVNSTDEIIDIVGYDYDSISPEELVIGVEKNIVNIYYTKRTDLSYEVNYLEEGTNKALADKKEVFNQTYLDTITETAIDITGYSKVGETTKTITINVEGNVINFYYTAKEVKYTVNYLDKETNEKIRDSKNLTAIFGTKVESESHVEEIYGYRYDSSNVIELTISSNEEENVINLYYTAVTGKVIVKYEDEDGNDIIDSTIIEGNVSDDYETTAKEIEKYVLVEVKGNEKGQITEEDIIVRYVYEAIPDTGLFVNNNSMYGLVISAMILFVLTFVKKKINL